MAQNNNGNREFVIPTEVKNFMKMTKKKYTKKCGDGVWDKDDIASGYWEYMMDKVPYVINLFVNYGQRKEVKEIKEAVYEKLYSPKFIKKLKKIAEKDKDSIDNFELMAIMNLDVIREAAKQRETEKSAGREEKDFDLSDIVELSNILLKKKMKKLKKEGISDELAFDCLSVIPTTDIINDRNRFRLRQMMNVLYNYADRVDVDFEKILKYVVGAKNYGGMIVYLLLERKEDYIKLSEKQKEFFNKVTDWCFNTMEEMEKEEIREILKTYFNVRKRDKANGNDSNRRFFLGSLPESDFPKTYKVLQKIKDADSSIEEFL